MLGSMSDMIALQISSSVDFLEYVLLNHAAPSTIIICSSREAFWEDVLLSIRQCTHDIMPATAEECYLESWHPLMIPTIHLLVTSRTIDLAFTPTLPHLRAYLASLGLSACKRSDATASRTSRIPAPTLAILGLIDIHRSTSEYSAQGLSRTLSIAVEASLAISRKLIIAEPLPPIEDEEAMATSEHEDQVAPDPWMEQIPILNGSIRSGGDQRIWAGRTIAVARVVGRWCKMVRLDKDTNRQEEGN